MIKLWQRISYMGINKEMHFENKRRIILLNRIAVALFLIVFTLRSVVVILGLQQHSIKTIGPFFAMFIILLIPYFNKKGYYKINSFIFCAIVPIAFMFFSSLSQQSNPIININHYYIPRIFIMSSLILPLILIDSKNKGLLISAIIINLFCIVFFDNANNLWGVPFNYKSVDFNHYESISYIMLLPALLIILAFGFLTNLNKKYEKQIIGLNTALTTKNKALNEFNKAVTAQNDTIDLKNKRLEQFNEEITSQRDLIAKKNNELENANYKIESIVESMTDSIVYAESIQRAVLKEQHLPHNIFSDSFIFFKPKTHVSGDFYYYKNAIVNNKECLIIAAVDCTGHGVPGGFLSMLGITSINEIVQNKAIKNAADILNYLRDSIKETLNQTGKLFEQQDGMEMALCIYYPETKTIDYAGARNPLCIVDQSNTLKTIKGDRQPIGIFLKEKDFTNHHIQFKGGEMVYIFSDGLQDQFGGLDGKKLKLINLQNLLCKNATETCAEQKKHIASYYEHWTNPTNHDKYEQIDDIVLIGMRI